MSNPLQYGRAGSQAYSPYYRHTGRITALGTVLGVIVGPVVAVGLGFVYAYAVGYCPIIYANIFIAIAFGLALGGATTYVMKQFKIRNLQVGMAIVMLSALLGYYWSWAVWTCEMIDRFSDIKRPFTFLDAALRPAMIVDFAKYVYDEGLWTLGRSSSSNKSTIKGLAIAFVWLVEAALIFGGAWVLAWRMLRDNAFCESCEQWCGKETDLRSLGVGERDFVRTELEKGNYGVLTPLLAGGNKWPRWTLKMQQCPKCQILNVVTLYEVNMTTDKQGKVQESATAVVRHLQLDQPGLKKLQAALMPGMAAVPAPAPMSKPAPIPLEGDEA
jgi:hypothetical protein